MIDKKRVEELALERMKERDEMLYIVELSINSGNRILLEIDKEDGSVSIEDCISVSRNIEHNLDREIEDFSLEVASAGLDQPFRVLKQYLKNVGKQVKVKTIEHAKSVEGTLLKADEEGIVVETKEKQRLEGKKKKIWVTEELPFKYEEIKETKLIISF
ncbi:MAG: ribosome assembly cofactor RimP [Flavobacteriales bacterium]|nr:ribosome assembly cofactor RimP [Flavobacteriales bacterium]